MGKTSDTVGTRWPDEKRKKLEALVSDEQRKIAAVGFSARVTTTGVLHKLVDAEFERRGLAVAEPSPAPSPAPAASPAEPPQLGASGELRKLLLAARALGWSNRKIARRAGVAAPRISELESGKVPTPALSDALFDALFAITGKGVGPDESDGDSGPDRLAGEAGADGHV